MAIFVFMHPDDASAAGLENDDPVVITSHFNGEERSLEGFRLLTYAIPSGCVATYYPESNPLVPVDHVADISNTPAYKSVVVSIRHVSA